MPKVFLSYRRDDSADAVGRIDDHLVAEYGRENVFKDVDSIPLGVDFPAVLSKAVGRCDVVLVVIGPQWVSVSDEAGNRRLDDRGDFVRIEVESALSGEMPVIPILLGAASMPKAQELPDSIRGLCHRNAARIRRDPDFRQDIRRLIDGVNRVAGEKGSSLESHVAPADGRNSPCDFVATEIATSGTGRDLSWGPASIHQADVTRKAGTPPLDGYTYLEQLGKGGQGEVWSAVQDALGRRVAIKTLRRDVRGGAGTMDTIRKEARTLATMQHPNVISVFDLRESDDNLFIIMQLVAGGSLSELIASGKRLDWHVAARLVADVAEGLRDAHDLGLVHRDVKPANVLLSENHEEAILTDFGLAVLGSSEKSVAGTPQYMAPEAFVGDVCPKTDVFGLACTLFSAIAGTPPFRIHQMMERDEIVRRIRAGIPDDDERWRLFPPSLEDVVRKGLCDQVDVRSTLKEFINGLRGSINQLAVDRLGTLIDANQNDIVHVKLERETLGGQLVRIDKIKSRSTHRLRDLHLENESSSTAEVRTGDRIRITVTTKQDGVAMLLNVGPTGNLNFLTPRGRGVAISPTSPLVLPSIELAAPAGQERILAVLSPVQSELIAFRALDELDLGVSSRYRATRDLIAMNDELENRNRGDTFVHCLELDHLPPR